MRVYLPEEHWALRRLKGNIATQKFCEGLLLQNALQIIVKGGH